RPVLCQIPPYAGGASGAPPTTTPKSTKASPPTTLPGSPATTAKALGASGGDAKLTSALLPAYPGQASPTATSVPTPATSIVPNQPTGGTPVPPNSSPGSACGASNASQFPTTPVQDDT